jgi:hypothetical protein
MLVEDTPDGRYIVTGLEEGLPAHLSQKVGHILLSPPLSPPPLLPFSPSPCLFLLHATTFFALSWDFLQSWRWGKCGCGGGKRGRDETLHRKGLAWVREEEGNGWFRGGNWEGC